MFTIGKKTRKIPTPSNTGVVTTAQHQLNRIVSMANMKHENAMKVDGIPLYVWLKSRNGVRCTCHSELNQTNVTTAPNAPISDAGNGTYTIVSETLVDNSLQKFGGNSSSITDMKLQSFTFDSKVLGSNKITVSPAIQQALNNLNVSTNAYDGDDDLDTVSELERHISQDTKLNDILKNSRPNPTQDDSAAEHDARLKLTNPDEFLLYGGEHTKCGICFSAGWTEAYSMLNGQRYVCDASSSRPLKVKGFLANLKSKPHTFELSEYHKSAYIEWYFEGPSYFKEVLLIKARNNTGYTRGIKLIFKEAHNNTSSWADLNMESMKARNGLDNRLLIRAIPVKGEKYYCLTHVELVFQYSDAIIGQMPHIEDQLGFQFPDGLITSSIELPATVPYLTSGSIIYDKKFGKIWRITSMATSMTAQRQIYNNMAQVRMVQHYEPVYLLHLFDKPNLQLNYRDQLELNQGVRVK